MENLLHAANDPDILSCAFALDSGAHPSHVPHPIRITAPLQIPLYTKTSTSQRILLSHHDTTQILTDRDHRIRLKVVVNPKIQHTLI